MSASFIEVVELPVIDGKISEGVEAWEKIISGSGGDAVLYRHIEDKTLLEIRAYNSLDEITKYSSEREMLWENIKQFAAGDFRREIFSYIEEPKPTASSLPEAKYLQLRYVEVLPPKYDEYRVWRDKTIFEVVRKSDEISTFSAYHSLFSSIPGVLFLSSFDVDPDMYKRVFNSPRYMEIVQEAGDNYITGGNKGLATRMYARVTKEGSGK